LATSGISGFSFDLHLALRRPPSFRLEFLTTASPTGITKNNYRNFLDGSDVRGLMEIGISLPDNFSPTSDTTPTSERPSIPDELFDGLPHSTTDLPTIVSSFWRRQMRITLYTLLTNMLNADGSPPNMPVKFMSCSDDMPCPLPGSKALSVVRTFSLNSTMVAQLLKNTPPKA
jgi:hypothetical protein